MSTQQLKQAIEKFSSVRSRAMNAIYDF